MEPKPDQIDQYSYYDYKPAFGTVASEMMLPSWVPNDDKRRLQAYMLLAAYTRNTSRSWLDSGLSDAIKSARREYGDPATIIDSVVSSVLGDSQDIWVEKAVGEFDPDPDAVAQLDLLKEWAEKENFMMKVIEGEHVASELGDVVYVLGWDIEKNRPRLRVYDPGFYFPVLEEDSGEYPETVHIAYEFEREIDGKEVKFIRRITWSLEVPDDIEEFPPLNLPWNEEPTYKQCFYSDGEWRLDNMKHGLVDLDDTAAVWASYKVPLGYDFIPVVHVPNNVAEQVHFGTSSLARVLQILDDVVSTDTDLQAASATTGTPPIAISGAAVPTDTDGNITSYGPGTVLKTGDGTATVIDTSRSLDALLKYDEHLLSRLSVNSRIPESLLGRVKPNEVPSGIALTLSFTPHMNLIKEMRMVRKVKYRLLLRFVSRMYWLAGGLASVNKAELVFGSFLPADKQEASTLVNQLYRAEGKPMISLETAVEVLVQAGFPIEDAANEVRRIQEEDFGTANELYDATGDINLVLERLGIDSQIIGAAPVEDVGLPIEEGIPGEELQ